MKIAVTFFNSKNKQKKRYYSIYKDNIKISSGYILLSVVLSLMIISNIKCIFLSTNLAQVENIEISKEKLLAMNSYTNKDNYKLNIVENNNTEVVEENVPIEYVAIDKIADEYKEVPVFGNISKEDITIYKENDTYQKLNVSGVDITNYSTNRNIDFSSIMNMPDVYFSKSNEEIVLYTTHTSESYKEDGEKIPYSSPRRSLDGKYNMLEISATLAQNLNNKGINTIYSLTPHDYGEYNSAYWNSRQTLSKILEERVGNIIAIDVHRDAIEDLDFAPKVNIAGYDVASVMLVMGIGYEDEENPYYMDNLKLAFELQMLGNKIYPGLFRTMIIRNSVYNQDLNKNSFLIEIGASGNTIKEAKLATRCVSNLINILFKH